MITKTEGRYCDVGACNGVITSFFKSLPGDKGMVYAFELNPLTTQLSKDMSLITV